MTNTITINTFNDEFNIEKLQADTVKLDTVRRALDSMADASAIQYVQIEIGNGICLNVILYPDIRSGKFKYLTSMTGSDGMPATLTFNELSKTDLVKISDFMDTFESMKVVYGLEEGSQPELMGTRLLLNKNVPFNE